MPRMNMRHTLPALTDEPGQAANHMKELLRLTDRAISRSEWKGIHAAVLYINLRMKLRLLLRSFPSFCFKSRIWLAAKNRRLCR